jgi:hypothetical protein
MKENGDGSIFGVGIIHNTADGEKWGNGDRENNSSMKQDLLLVAFAV